MPDLRGKLLQHRRGGIRERYVRSLAVHSRHPAWEEGASSNENCSCEG